MKGFKYINKYRIISNLSDYITYDTNIFHIHIPKTGGSTLNYVFGGYDWFINGGHCSSFPIRVSHNIEGFFQPKMSKTYKEKGFDESMLKIAIIRSPFNWLKSIYFHRYYRKFIYLKYIDHKGWGNIVKDLRATDFEDFIIKYCNKSYRNKYTFVYDGVLKQLTDPIRNILDVDIIVYNEYLNDFIRELSSIKGISDKIDIKNLNKGNTKDVHISSYAESLLLRNFRSYMEFTGYNLYKLNVDKKRYIRVY